MVIVTGVAEFLRRVLEEREFKYNIGDTKFSTAFEPSL
jgi:hypothetical protein